MFRGLENHGSRVGCCGRDGGEISPRETSTHNGGGDRLDRSLGDLFFLRLGGADELFTRAAKRVAGSHPPEIGPHLSLMYSSDDKQIDRVALQDELAGSLPSAIRFDALALVCPASGRWEDVVGWQVVYTRSVG